LRGRLITIAALGLLAAAAAVSPALAGHAQVKHYAASISITTNKQAGLIKGQLSSPNADCVNGRHIDLYVDGDKVYGQELKSSGKYHIYHLDSNHHAIPLDPGDYQVKAPRKTLTPKKVCDPAHSKVSTVD
jgi:hypothetical protein